MKSLLTLICTFLLAVGFPLLSADMAQAANSVACDVIGEEIIPLRVPNFDVPILWKRTMGVDGPDLPADLISLADGGVIVVGGTAEYKKDTGLGPRQLYLARADINGKIVWEKKTGIKGFLNPAAGLAIKDRLAVLSGVDLSDKTKIVRLDFFDGAGALKSSKNFSDSKYDLIPQAMAADSASQSITLALWAVNRKDGSDNFTVLKQVSLDGRELSSRQYLPGLPNRLHSLRKMSNGDMVGSGQIQMNGVTAGWIFSVSGRNGDLIFQRPYIRGYQGNLRNVTEDGKGNFIAVGDSIPTDGGKRAAWVMKIDADGSPIWQKYVQGKYSFSGRDVSVYKDGRVLVLVNARPNGKDGGREHARLLTFTPQGNLQGDEALIEGANAQGMDLLVRDQSRIISGITQAGLTDYALAKDQKAAGYDFWLLGLPKLSVFEDGCAAVDIRDSFDEGY